MKKIFRLSAIVAMLSMMATATVATSCSDDDDDNNSEIKDSASLGNTDGAAFAEAYNTIKTSYQEGGLTSALTQVTAATTLINETKKYKSSENKTYKAAFIAGACGVNKDWAESEVTSLLGGIDVTSTANAITTLVSLFTSSSN